MGRHGAAVGIIAALRRIWLMQHACAAAAFAWRAAKFVLAGDRMVNLKVT
jgi:hypothetical protein